MKKTKFKSYFTGVIFLTIIFFGIFTTLNFSLAATINVDASNAGAAIPEYYKWQNIAERSYKGSDGRGPLDAARLKELGPMNIRAFTVPYCWAPNKDSVATPTADVLNNLNNYDFSNTCFGPYGNDGLLDWIAFDVGAQLIISLHQKIPAWLRPWYQKPDGTLEQKGCDNYCRYKQSAYSCFPNNLDNYETLMTQAVRHYKQRYGSKFEYFDVFNEAICGNISPSEYGQMHERVVKAVQTVNREFGAPFIKVGGPGDCTENTNFLTETLKKLQAHDPDLPHEWTSWHYYGGAGYGGAEVSPGYNKNLGEDMARYDNILKNYGFSDPANRTQWAGEFAYDGNNDSPSNLSYDSPYPVSQQPPLTPYFCPLPKPEGSGPVQPTNLEVAMAAGYIASQYHLVLNKATELGITFNPLYYSLEEYPNPRRSVLVPNRVRNKNTGVCEDGKVFPVYNVMKFWKDLSGLPRLAATSNESVPLSPGAGAVAAGNNNTIKVMAYNNSNTKSSGQYKNVDIAVNNLPEGLRNKTLNITRYLTDATHGNYMYDPSLDRAEKVSELNLISTNSVTTNLALDNNAVTFLVITASQNTCAPKTEICGNGIDEDCNGSDLICSGVNILTNGDFGSGTASWTFYTDGAGSFSVENGQAKIQITTPGANVQLNQPGIALEPNTAYRLSFNAYSNTGHDLEARLIQNVSPYANYGLNQPFNLGTGWSTHSTQFTTAGFSSNVSDARLYFWLAPYDALGDQYYFDDVKLEKISSSDSTPPACPVNLTVQ
ncbi:MAG: carbohydrate binding domain-containing protein [Parcubacteria group bacterium]